jgi:hypothetical protein
MIRKQTYQIPGFCGEQSTANDVRVGFRLNRNCMR